MRRPHPLPDRVLWLGASAWRLGRFGREDPLHLGFHPGPLGRYDGGPRRHPAPFRPCGRMQLPLRRPEIGGIDVRTRLLVSELDNVRVTHHQVHPVPPAVGDVITVRRVDGPGGSKSKSDPGMEPGMQHANSTTNRARRRPMGSSEIPRSPGNVWPRHARARACIVSSIEREFDVRSNDRAAGRGAGECAGSVDRACRGWRQR